MCKWDIAFLVFMLLWEHVLGKTKFGSTVGLLVNPVIRMYRRVRYGKGD